MTIDPNTQHETINWGLSRAVSRVWPGRVVVSGLTRLTGGAASQTFSFIAERPDGSHAKLILRREHCAEPAQTEPNAAPDPSQPADLRYGPGWAGEFAILQAAGAAGVPVPPTVVMLEPADGIGQGFIMGFIEGETLARRVLREPQYETARATMAAQCGIILASIHKLAPERVPGLATLTTRAHIAHYRERLRQWDEPMPVLELGLRWIEQHCPPQASEILAVVHGDFRHGNLIIGPDGVRAVLDWEAAHLGDPYEDIGWICTKAWRFGGPKPVGGFGEREDFYRAYEAASGLPVDRARARFWEIFGSLRWAIMCLGLAQRHLSGRVRSLEFAAIGRRVAENEHDLLALIGQEA